MEKLLLADDDMDDRLFFQDAVEDLFSTTTLSTVSDGVELMEFLTNNTDQLPDVLFLDLNMPRKTGCECLLEIKCNEELKFIPVVIFSTSMDIDMVNKLYEMGAHYYIRKPGDFGILKKAIYQATVLLTVDKINQPERSKFIIQC
ncbi:response regulator [Flavobacterium sp. P4023]|uniref:Response regulator n=1 Tax=Flavobacterium flabelliforme TaxID=2816119 RepID=A0ABS5CTS0_9FLAO|nr:response regulator [Flavobacterium flabelliforme]MBP4142019.1 response regulator [Flavobacterium flabelliforme]